jgi:hypothetical protein
VAGQGAENGDPHQIDRVMTDLFWEGAFGWQNRGPDAEAFRRLKAERQRAIGPGPGGGRESHLPRRHH